MRVDFYSIPIPPWPALALALATTAAAHGTNGTTERVSLAGDGSQASGYDASLSADGRYVAFATTHALLPEDTDVTADIYVYDRASGDLSCASTTAGGVFGNGASESPDISADGRYVAFESDATNLVVLDLNGAPDVLVKDLLTGAIERVSQPPGSIVAGNGSSWQPSLSGDGRFVAFQSSANNLVPSDTNGALDIFVADRTLGTLVRASHGLLAQSNGASSNASISCDGTHVAFQSAATNLVLFDVNALTDIFVWNLGASVMTIVSRPGAGQADAASLRPSLSGDGQWVAFTSYATNLVAGDINAQADIFLSQLGSGVQTMVSPAPGTANDDSDFSAISADGRYVVYHSDASNLVLGDTNGFRDVFVYDSVAGTTVLASRPTGPYGNGDEDSHYAAISAQGDLIAFASRASNLVPGDSNGGTDVFVRELYADPESYCQGSTTSAGCEPAIGWIGLSRAASVFGFQVSASGVPNQKAGLLFYGTNGPANIPLLGGTLCVQPPNGRTPLVFSGGAPPPADDCSGTFVIDLNSFAAGSLGGNPHPSLSQVGTEVHVQWWGRDPGSPFGTLFSNALSYEVGP